MITCIGYKDKLKRLERSERRLNYHIVKGWADPKTFNKTMEQWWQIDGEVLPKIKLPSKAKLKKYEQLFKQLGKK